MKGGLNKAWRDRSICNATSTNRREIATEFKDSQLRSDSQRDRFITSYRAAITYQSASIERRASVGALRSYFCENAIVAPATLTELSSMTICIPRWWSMHTFSSLLFSRKSKKRRKYFHEYR